MADLNSRDLSIWASGYLAGYDTGRHAGISSGEFHRGFNACRRLMSNTLAEAIPGGMAEDTGQIIRRLVGEWDRKTSIPFSEPERVGDWPGVDNMDADERRTAYAYLLGTWEQ